MAPIVVIKNDGMILKLSILTMYVLLEHLVLILFHQHGQETRKELQDLVHDSKIVLASRKPPCCY